MDPLQNSLRSDGNPYLSCAEFLELITRSGCVLSKYDFVLIRFGPYPMLSVFADVCKKVENILQHCQNSEGGNIVSDVCLSEVWDRTKMKIVLRYLTNQDLENGK